LNFKKELEEDRKKIKIPFYFKIEISVFQKALKGVKTTLKVV